MIWRKELFHCFQFDFRLLYSVVFNEWRRTDVLMCLFSVAPIQYSYNLIFNRKKHRDLSLSNYIQTIQLYGYRCYERFESIGTKNERFYFGYTF